MTAVTVPQLSISMEEAKVSRWLIADGATVARGQLVVEVETDKATVEIESPTDGVLRIVAAEGAIVPVEGVLAELEPVGAIAAEPQLVSSDAAPAQGALSNGAVAADPPSRRDGPIASPAARRLAHERGVELSALRGTGPGGRIVARDVQEVPVASIAPGSERMRQAVVANIAASWQQIPHVHIGGELDAGGLVAARAEAGAGVTVTDLLILAVVRALGEVPELNGLLRAGGTVERGQSVHLSLAVATPDGVVAPVLRDAETLTLAQVAEERRRLVEAARSGTIDGRDLTGGTCTLTNLGAHPVDFFAPVVSGPQVAMIATGRVADRVVPVDGLIGVRPRMWVNVAIDHRAADGEAGGRLLAALERQIARLPGGLT